MARSRTTIGRDRRNSTPLTEYHWPPFRDLRVSGAFQTVDILLYHVAYFRLFIKRDGRI